MPRDPDQDPDTTRSSHRPCQQRPPTKYVFITGASKGIGRETTLSYARAGCTGIAIGARGDLTDLAQEIRDAATRTGKPVPHVVSLSLDVTDSRSVDRAVETIVSSSFPRIDILINNAGYLEQRRKLADSDPDEWWRTWRLNLLGPYLVTRAVIPHMVERGGEKTIVNIASVAAHLTSPGGSSYQTSKLALLRLTEFVNVDYGADADGILAYAVHPGGVLTDMGNRLPAGTRAMLKETPQLCADTLVFPTERRRGWLAGRYISATWDVEELLAREKEITHGDKLKVRMVV
ncbi:hypothetical protein BJY01DRAFT_238221 [Aspergillus pseudoustus]|uniref:NAD(P)-binding protein n=1 Tax=Aspergillus pseudoustus TaxID=1810923 RepID=A0ABR4J965_9EURO